MVLRIKKHVRVSIPRLLDRRIRKLAAQADRPITHILVHFTYLTFKDVNGEKLFYTDHTKFVPSGQWCRSVLHAVVPRPMFEQLADIAWESGIKSSNGASIGVSLLMGLCADHQLKKRSIKYWAKYFRLGKDIESRISEHFNVL